MNKVQCKSKGWQHISCCRKMTRTEPGCSWWGWWEWEAFFLWTPRGFLKLVLLQWTINENCQWIFHTLSIILLTLTKSFYIECLQKKRQMTFLSHSYSWNYFYASTFISRWLMLEDSNITRLGWWECLSGDFLTLAMYWITRHFIHRRLDAMARARGPKTLEKETCSG